MVRLKNRILPSDQISQYKLRFCLLSAPNTNKTNKLPAFESNWIPFLENKDILTKLEKTLFPVLGQLKHLNHLGCASKSTSWHIYE